MIYIKKYSTLVKQLSFLLVILILSACSGTQIVSSSTGTIMAASQSEKTIGNVFDDLSIKLGIKDKLFMHKVEYLTRINVEVNLGKVLLTGKVINQDERVMIVKIAWKQPGVSEVLNEIVIEEIEEGFDLKRIAADKFIKTQLLAKIISDKQIKNFKFNIEVQDKIIYLVGLSSNQNEIDRLIMHARTIKGVVDIINYIDLI